nr:NAD(P)/FAD-dependent oxidoreductase [Leifsonia psychrotolerans]
MRDVIIVGAGPVGMMLACQLAVRGLDIVVVERRTEPSLLSRAIGIHPPGLRALEQIGVLDDLLADAVKISEGEVSCDGALMGRLSFTRVGGRHPFVAALPQYETESLLRARFAQLCPGGLREGVTVSGLLDQGDRVELHTTDVGSGTESGVRSFCGRFVVGADGARSRVRAAAGIGWRTYGRGASYLMADLADRGVRSSTARLFFERAGVVESFPLPAGRRRWVALTESLMLDSSVSDLAALIRDRVGEDAVGRGGGTTPDGADGASDVARAAGDRRAPASAFAVQQRLADRMVSGRVVLVGDAAHEISPIGGQGMNLGWLDAVALAPVLELALQPGPSDQRAAAAARAAAALAGYERTRLRAARMAVRQAGFNMAMGRPATGIRLTARNALVRTLALPPTRGLLARAFTMRWL